MLTHLEQTEKDEKHKEHLLLPARPLPNFELMSSYFPTKKYKKYKRKIHVGFPQQHMNTSVPHQVQDPPTNHLSTIFLDITDLISLSQQISKKPI